MRLFGRWGFGLQLVLLGATLVPTAARAQAGFYVTPSVSLAEVYDDNLFYTADRRQSDFITRVSPEIEAGYQSPAFRLLGRYTFDAEVFARHTELTSAQNRQHGSLDLLYRPTPSLTLSLNGGYQTTQTPAELNLQTGLQTGRARAERILASPSVIYRLNAITGGTADYAFTRDTSAGTTADTHTATLGLERGLSERDTATVRYTLRRFDFTDDISGTDDSTTSHLVMVGWMGDLTPLTRLTLRAGPRVSDGSVDPEAFASLRRLLRHGEVSLAYERTQSTVVGQRGVVESDGFTAVLTHQLLPSLRFTAAPSFFLSRGVVGQAKVYRVILDATYALTRSVSLTGSYEFTFQQGSVGSAARRHDDIRHNVVLVRLTVTLPYRVR